MTNKTTNTLRLSMHQIVDMTPAAPDLPTISQRRGGTRPLVALAGGFVAVLLIVGAGAAMLTRSDNSTIGVGAQATVDSPVLIVYFQPWIDEPPDAVVESLRAHPQVVELIASDITKEEAVVREWMAASGIPNYEPAHPLLATLRVRVASDDAAKTVNAFAQELEGVLDIDAYFRAADMYPDLTYEGNIGEEDLTIYEDNTGRATTTTIAVTAITTP